MKTIFKLIISSKKGNIALMTFLMLSTVLTVTLGTATLVIQSLKIGKTQTRSVKAFFAAEAGAERILYEVRVNGRDLGPSGWDCALDECFEFDGSDNMIDCINCSGGTVTQSLNNGSRYKIKYKDNTCDLDVCFDSIGDYSQNQRSIKIQYCAPGSPNPEC